MYCMKCGREVDDKQVFCQECLAQMEQEPVDMRTAVKIPRQPPRNAKHRPPVHLEEEVKRLDRGNTKLRAWVILLATSTVLLSMAMYYNEVMAPEGDLGRNYSIVETHQGSR